MSGGAAEDEAEAKAFLMKLRYSPAVADGVIVALKSSGALLPTLYAMAGAWVPVPPPLRPLLCVEAPHESALQPHRTLSCRRRGRWRAPVRWLVRTGCGACTSSCSGMCWGLKFSRGAGSGGRRWAGGTGKGGGARASGKRRGQGCPLPS
jgi:hypothetical protein